MRVPGPPTKVQFARPLYSGGRVGPLASGLVCITSMCLTVPFAGNVKGGLKGQACTVCSSRTTATNSEIAARWDVFFGILLCYGVKRCCERAQRSFGRCRNFEDQQNSGCEIHALRGFPIAAHQRGEKCLVTSYVGGWPPSRPSAVFLRSSVTSTCRRCQRQVTPTAPWSTIIIIIGAPCVGVSTKYLNANSARRNNSELGHTREPPLTPQHWQVCQTTIQ